MNRRRRRQRLKHRMRLRAEMTKKDVSRDINYMIENI